MNRSKKLKKGPIITLSILVLVLAFSSYFMLFSNWDSSSNATLRDDPIQKTIDNDELPKPSATLTHNITIDDSLTGIGAHNWTWASGEAWCSGSGTILDPYLIDSQNIYLNNTNTACINISNSHDVYFTISNLIVRNNASDYGIGIALTSCYDGTIDTVTASSNGDDGIYLLNCRNITISDTTMNSNHHYGLNMDNTTISTMTTCTMNLNTLGGSILINSTSNLFQTTCNFNNNSFGLIFSDSDSNNVTDCNFYNNSQWAFEILNSDSSIVTNNSIEDNPLGIYVYDETGNSELNEFYGNDFNTNTNHAEDNSTGAGNTWDNGVDSGNDWDDYSGTDDDDDGIGDDPYDVNGAAGAQDNYPIFSDGDDTTAPRITIVLPTYGAEYKSLPSFAIFIVEAVHLNVVSYNLNGLTNITITGAETGANTDYFNSAQWSSIQVPDGEKRAVTITFYASDLAGNIGSAQTTIIKVNEESEKTVYMYALSQNQIFILTGFALALSLALRMIIIRGKRF